MIKRNQLANSVTHARNFETIQRILLKIDRLYPQVISETSTHSIDISSIHSLQKRTFESQENSAELELKRLLADQSLMENLSNTEPTILQLRDAENTQLMNPKNINYQYFLEVSASTIFTVLDKARLNILSLENCAFRLLPLQLKYMLNELLALIKSKTLGRKEAIEKIVQILKEEDEEEVRYVLSACFKQWDKRILQKQSKDLNKQNKDRNVPHKETNQQPEDNNNLADHALQSKSLNQKKQRQCKISDQQKIDNRQYKTIKDRMKGMEQNGKGILYNENGFATIYGPEGYSFSLDCKQLSKYLFMEQ